MNRPRFTAKMDDLRSFLTRNLGRVLVAAIICFAIGVMLSNRVAPGVQVRKVTLAGGTPALKFIPAGAEPHPVALLGHGYSASKENLFWYGEALSAAGFLCYSVDLPGHGESPRLYSFVETAHAIGDLAQAIGPVDVFIGHSMGGGAGGEAVREGLLRPKLVIAVGSAPRLGESAPPLLLLVGRFDEFFKSDELKARTDAQLIISPWSDHGLELFDPMLIHAAVNAACVAVGKTPSQVSTSWCWHVAGIFLTILGAFGLALVLPMFPRRWGWLRGLVVSVIFSCAFLLIAGRYLDFKPHARDVPLQIGATLIALLVLASAGKLQLPRWLFAALAAVLAVACVIVTNSLATHMSISLFHILRFALVLALALFVGTIVGGIAAFRGSRSSGDIAMAVIIGLSFFQTGNAPRTMPEPSNRHLFIKLDAKLCDACVGHYEIAPDNVFRTGAEVGIWRQGSQMFLQATGRLVLQGIHEIFPESETNFFLKVNGAELAFIKNDKGEVTGFIHHMEGLPDSEARRTN